MGLSSYYNSVGLIVGPYGFTRIYLFALLGLNYLIGSLFLKPL